MEPRLSLRWVWEPQLQKINTTLSWSFDRPIYRGTTQLYHIFHPHKIQYVVAFILLSYLCLQSSLQTIQPDSL
jgi:hypothetical protein